MSIAIAIGFVFFIIIFILGGAWAQAAPPRIKRMRKTKPMAMAMLTPILIGTFWYFFLQNGSTPSNLTPSGLFQWLAKKHEKNKANGNGNAHANFDWYFLLLFFKMVRPHLSNPI